jgi:sigma-B regulation protein RsbU (phosphoserine phosphatase)
MAKKNVEKIRPEEILNLEVMQQLQDALAELTGASMVICRRDGQIFTRASFGSPLWRNIAEAMPDVSERFGATASKTAKRFSRTEDFLRHDGRHGIVEFFAPVVVNDIRFCTLVVINDVRWWFTDLTPDAVSLACRCDIDAVRAEFAAPPALDADRLEHHIRLAHSLFTSLVDWSRRERQLKLRVREFAMLHSVASLYGGRADLDEILNITAQQVVDVTQSTACSIRIYDAAADELRIQAVANLSQEYLRKGAVKLRHSKIDQQALRGEPVPIRDMANDPRVLYSNEAEREGLVSGLAIGMLYRGEAVGVIHVYTDRPYAFHRFEIEALKAIASQAASAIVNARLHQDAWRAEQVERQMAMAAQVQRRMLPKTLPKIKDSRLGAVFEPSYAIGGDFYDFMRFNDDRLGLAIADVAGKGVPASLQMASLRSSLRAFVSERRSLVETVQFTNEAFERDTLVGEFASLFVGVFNPTTGDFEYVNAGHNPPILARNNRLHSLDVTGPVVGVFRKPNYTAGRIRLHDGDTLVLYTDGAFDAMNFDGKLFGMHRLRQSIRRHLDHSAQAMANNLLWDVRRFVGLATQSDDITLLVLKFKNPND